MAKNSKSGLLLGGLLLAVGGGVGVWWVLRNKNSNVQGIAGAPPFPGADWNHQQVQNWRLQQMKLHRQHQGIPQLF